MGRPKGSKNGVAARHNAPFNPTEEDVRDAAANVLSSLLASRDARIALYDSGRALIDMCYPSLSVKARHHKSLYELDPDDLHLLQTEDFDALGKGFKSAPLDDVIALPGTKKL
jgi:hypothetical protein